MAEDAAVPHEQRFDAVVVCPRSSMGYVRLVGVGRSEEPSSRADDPRTELLRFDAALALSRQQLEAMRKGDRSPEAEDILAQQLDILGDPTFIRAVIQGIKKEFQSATRAVGRVIDDLARKFAGMDDPYLRAREADIQDVGQRIRKNLLGEDPNELLGIDRHTILVAEDLAPSIVIQLEQTPVGGIVMDKGAQTSHAAIMARGMGIPCLVAAGGVLEAAANGDALLIDGASGVAILHPSDATQAALSETLSKGDVLPASQPPSGETPPLETRDGQRVHLRANVTLGAEVRSLSTFRAEGVGLFRTEYLFLGRARPPNLKAQLRIYSRAIEDAGGEVVTFRTLDLGGDKETPFFGQQPEENPAMGRRSVRLCLAEETAFRTQLRAILMASAGARVRLMYPMITTIADLDRANALLQEVKDELARDGIPHAADLKAGMMVEVPAAALMARRFAPRVEFFSIGTNDLLQFLMAADRCNPDVQEYLDGAHPALLDLVRMVVAAAREAGIPVSCCGELPAEPVGFTLLLGAGVRDFSMNLFAVPRIREIAARIDIGELEDLLVELREASGAAEVRRRVERYLEGLGLPVRPA